MKNGRGFSVITGWAGIPATCSATFLSFPLAKCQVHNTHFKFSLHLPSDSECLALSESCHKASNQLIDSPKKCILFSHYEFSHNAALYLALLKDFDMNMPTSKDLYNILLVTQWCCRMWRLHCSLVDRSPAWGPQAATCRFPSLAIYSALLGCMTETVKWKWQSVIAAA